MSFYHVYYGRPPPEATRLLAHQVLRGELQMWLSNDYCSLDERNKAVHECTLTSAFRADLSLGFADTSAPIVITDVRVTINAYGDSYPEPGLRAILSRLRGRNSRWYRRVDVTREATIDYYAV